MNEDKERPLECLTLHEQAIELVRLRGDMRVEIAELKAAVAASHTALELQAAEYARRLMDLNHEAQQLKDMQAKYTPRETYDRDAREADTRIRRLENLSENWAGRMWLPMITAAGLAAGITAAVVKTMFP